MIPLRDQIKLITLIKKHNSLAEQMHQYNMAFRRTVCFVYLCSSFIINLALHLIMATKNSFEKTLYGQYIASVIIAGFGVAFLFSMQIKSAHRSSKIIYQILSKQKFLFRFQWHVSKWINKQTKHKNVQNTFKMYFMYFIYKIFF